MLDNNLLNNVIQQSVMAQAIMNKNVTKDIVKNYMSTLENNETFVNQMDNLFQLFYNNFNATDTINDVEYLYSIFLMAPAFEDQNDNVNNKEQIAHVYAEIIVFINTILNDENMLLVDKTNQLLDIDYKVLPKSEAKKSYLYYLLNILLAQPIDENIKLMQEITEELKNTLIK